jgi:D-glycero-alpha-D-manno-heptose-7-phosphate kinase
MLIISRTPVRISLFGGGTDYPSFFNRSYGLVLGTTINKYTYVSLNKLSAFFEYNIRVSYSKTELVNDLDEIIHPSVKNCLKFTKTSGNLDIHIFSDLPAKTGLGTSSAFTVSFLNALYALKGKFPSKQQLAEEACLVEQKFIKENVGSQDQFHAAYGGFNLIEFREKKISVRPVSISNEKLDILEKHLLIFYTGLTRFASEVVKEQIAKTISFENDKYLFQMRAMVYEAEKIILNSSNNEMVKKLGLLLDESWQLKKHLSSQISNPIIDSSYEAAKNAGAYGCKLCGAGSGGFLAILAPISKHKEIKAALKNLLQVDFKFENEGATIIYKKE